MTFSPCLPFFLAHSPGNMFSTVRGHVFEWSLLKDSEAKHQTLEPDAILHFVDFSDSVYATDPVIGLLEEQVTVADSGVVRVTVTVPIRMIPHKVPKILSV